MQISVNVSGYNIPISVNAIDYNYDNYIENNNLYSTYYINADYHAYQINSSITTSKTYNIILKIKFTFNDGTSKTISHSAIPVCVGAYHAERDESINDTIVYSTVEVGSYNAELSVNIPTNLIVAKVQLIADIKLNNTVVSTTSGQIYTTYTQNSINIGSDMITINDTNYAQEILLYNNSDNSDLDNCWQKYNSITDLTPETKYYLVVETTTGIIFIIPFTTLELEGNIYFNDNGEYKLGTLYVKDPTTNTYKLGMLYRKTDSGYVRV